jgi:hypothetical protein
MMDCDDSMIFDDGLDQTNKSSIRWFIVTGTDSGLHGDVTHHRCVPVVVNSKANDKVKVTSNVNNASRRK